MDVLHMKSEVQSRMTAFSDAQAEKFVKSVCRELIEKGEQWALKRWRLIIQYLTHHRFKAAVSHHRFSASFLAHSEEPAFVRQIMALETMTPDKFGRFIIDKPPEKHDDPEVSNPRQARTRGHSVTFSKLPEEAGSRSTKDAVSEGGRSRARGQSE